MSAASVITNQYAKAAFHAAKRAGTIEQFLHDLKLFSDNFSVLITKELGNPTISRANLANIIGDLAKKISLNSKVTEFLMIVAEARRIQHIKAIYQDFLKLSKLDKNILAVKLFTVNALEADQLGQIKDLLQKKYSGKTIEINQIIKPDILGGILIQIDSLVIDATLKNQLLAIYSACNSTIV
jgi:F-type H+-transporting ATPase subunit delta